MGCVRTSPEGEYLGKTVSDIVADPTIQKQPAPLKGVKDEQSLALITYDMIRVLMDRLPIGFRLKLAALVLSRLDVPDFTL